MITIDDFMTGPYTATLTSGFDRNGQTATVFGAPGLRATGLEILGNDLNQLASLEIGSRGAILSTGVFLRHRLHIHYGYDGALNFTGLPPGLLTGADRFVLNLNCNDQSIGLNIQVFSSSGKKYSQKAMVIEAGVALSAEFPFSEFPDRPVNPDDVGAIILMFQTGTAPGGNDYSIKSFEAA
ncbi:MAG: hypothetical protein L0287_19765 [Anaerolineae bacterium]|nr:hypothetical protein [Anaerolineae bacterium]MCI0611052.1 hypothetical protein [Anaerolineae bacterium]